MAGKVNVGVSVIMVSGGKLLLGERNEPGELGHFGWTTPGGKLEEGETIIEGAIREVEEETGLKLATE